MAWASECGQDLALDFEIFSKKCFLSFEWKKNFTTFASSPLEKNLEKYPSGPPWEKILPTPMFDGTNCVDDMNINVDSHKMKEWLLLLFNAFVQCGNI